ncbi:MAG: permease [Solirubrobacteraceae bacterium]|nr:permease [Solirubrobacteraceae bacterium]
MSEGKLEKGLKQRHMTMISLGGVIGAGLFVGSGAVMNSTGPAAIVSYLAAGLLVVLVMRMLGEMAVADPTVGSFMEYTRKALGERGGFTIGWLYWYFWAIVLAVEATAGAEILQNWLPGVPIWLMSLILMSILTATNLTSVKNYGEFEFWFASIKVAAILVFIAIGIGYLVGIGGGDSPGLSNLTSHGGFFAQGGVTILSGIVIVIFAFVGAEIVTIAAAESKEPERAVARATQAIVWRVLVFYVLSVFLVVAILPWNASEVGNSPFIAALERVGIPGAADIMNAIVVTAVLSCLNSGIYTGSRMLFSLARRGYAPEALVETNSRGVPVKGILLTVSIGFLSVIAAAIWPDTLFEWLVNSSGAVALFCYVMIAISQLRLRPRTDPEALTLKMWLFPWLTYLSIAAMVVVIGAMAFVDEVRSQLWWSLASLAIVVGLSWVLPGMRAPSSDARRRRAGSGDRGTAATA